MTFLGAFDEVEPTPWTLPPSADAQIEPTERFKGPGHLGLEVAVATSARKPLVPEIRSVWKAREDTKGFPLLLVVLYDKAGVQVAAVCGPMGPSPVIVHDVDPAVVERLCAAALSKPDRITALSFLTSHEVEQQSELPGIRNVGLFATNELANGVPTRDDWDDACQRGSSLRGKTNQALIADLGYEIEPAGPHTSLLVTAAGKHAVAVFLDEGDEFETPTQKLELFSPVTHALVAADRLGLDWVVLVRGSTLRLYPARPDVGVGRRGRSGTYVEASLDLLGDDQVGMAPLFFGSEALQPGGTVDQVLESSSLFVAKLGGRLRDRIYFDAVPGLAATLASKHGDTTPEGLLEAYAQTMAVLFRLLFVAYAEDKELLPYRTNGLYAEHALTTLAKRLSEYRSTGETFDANGTDLWDDAQALWTAIEHGRDDWDIPAYGGTLFSSDPDINSSGAALAGYRLTNEQFGPTLSALLVDADPDGLVGPVDFRSLSVREFGTIYEGLLESELSLAPYDMTEDASGLRRAEPGDEVHTLEGAPWFHNRSGERKSTGSYFTKPFAVEHLLKTALAPALDSHFGEVSVLLTNGDEAGAAKRLFEFRCADLAMGSGHFLVAAIDHLEAAFSKFLIENPIGPVNAELVSLRTAAINQLGHLSDSYQIDDTQILRRLIARRCVFGCDLNPVAVGLARLSIWIHTFVAGLPLGFLDHNLRIGNSLTGIGVISEVDDFLGEENFLVHQIADQLSEASRQLQRLATVNDAKITDIEAARQAVAEAQEALNPMRRLLDLIVLRRSQLIDIEPMALAETSVVDARHSTEQVQELLATLRPIHFPIEFPEIFSGPNPGFNCILGNPPWEEIMVDEDSFWATKSPGFYSLEGKKRLDFMAGLASDNPLWLAEYEDRVAEMRLLRESLTAGPYPDLNRGNADLYKAFCWRFWHQLADQGVVGVVLPRSAVSARGSASWREQVLDTGDFIEVTQLLNNRRWIFEDVHPQYTICLVSIRKTGKPDDEVAVRGPFSSHADYKRGVQLPPTKFPTSELRSWTEGASFPLIPNPQALETFLRLRRSRNLADVFEIRPIQGDFNATTGRKAGYFSVDMDAKPVGALPVLGGASFDIWKPDTGVRKGWADPSIAIEELQRRRTSGSSKKSSAFYGFDDGWICDESTLPARNYRIAFRGVTNRTNRRTVIASLVMPDVILENSAGYLLWTEADEHRTAFLLGTLCSTSLDWYARRVVELSLNFFILNQLPIPEPTPTDDRYLRTVEISGRLAAADDRFASWAEAVGVPVGSVTTQAEKDELIAELDAVVAHLYGLDADDLEVIWDTFHPTVDHLPSLDKVLGYHETWAR
jgi:hypothetical protein